MNTKGFGQGVTNMKHQFSGLESVVKKVGFAIGAVFAIGKIVQFGKEAVELGSDLQEVQNVVDSVFTTMSAKVDEFAKNASATAGLSETMAKRYTGTFGAMSKFFGFAESEAYEMSTALTQLAGDVASFYNISQDEAYTKLKSVFTGETETLKELGVVMTQNALDSYAMANGYGKTTQAMSEQEKVALRYRFVMDQLSTASGDFFRTSDGWANQVRVLKLQVDSLKATIGQGLINVFTPVIKVINILLAKLATVANAFKSFTELITGKKSSGKTGSASAGLSASSLTDAGGAYNDAAEGAENLAGATENVANATKQAEKTQKSYLSGLDEIKKFETGDIPDAASGGGGSGTPSSALGDVGNVDYGNLAEGETVIEKFSEKLLHLRDILLKIFQPFKEAWEKEGKNTIEAAKYTFSELGGLAQSVGKSILEVWTNGTGTQALSIMLQIAQNVFDTIGNIAKRLKRAWNTNKVGTRIVQNLANAFQSVLDFINIITESTAEWAKNINFYLLLEAIVRLTESMAPLIDTIGNVLGGIYETIILPMLTFLIETALPWIIEKISDLFTFISENQWIIELFGSVLIGAFAAGIIVPHILSIVGAIGEINTIVKGAIKLLTGSGGFIGGIKALAATLGTGGVLAIAIAAAVALLVLLVTHWDDVKKTMAEFDAWLSDFFAYDWTKDFGILGEGLNQFFRNVSNVWESIKQVFDGVITFITGVFSGNWRQAWEGIKQIFSGVFSGLANIAKAPLNAIIGAFNAIISVVNSMISKINSIRFRITVPDWIPGVGGSWWGFNGFSIPYVGSIPYLAKGAVIPPNAPFMAMLGDQKHGNNIEAPEDLIRKIVREETGNQGFNGEIRIPIILDGRQVYEAVVRQADLARSRNGGSLFGMT